MLVCAGPLDQTARTLTDAVALFEVLSPDTAITDRVDKLIEYAEAPGLRAYVLVEQTAQALTVMRREAGGEWIASGHTAGEVVLPDLDVTLPMEAIYRGLTFPAVVETD